MPHSASHDSDFRNYRADRRRVLNHIRDLRSYLAQLEQVVKAMPTANESAGYLDLDIVNELRRELAATVGSLCDWNALDLEICRLGLPAEFSTRKAPE